MKQYNSKCPVCKSDRIFKLKGYERHDLTKCKKCGFVFEGVIPTSEELEMHYCNYSYDKEQYLSPITIKSYNNLLDEFDKFRQSNKILDVGCGRGFFLEIANQRGWQTEGIEYSKKAIEICKKKGIKVHESSFNLDDFEGKPFDVITSFEVIEHINNPIEVINNIKALVRKGGLFYCTTPNFNSYLRYLLKDRYNIIDYPEHLSYYTKSTLNKVITESGFIKYKILCTGISISRWRSSTGKSEGSLCADDSVDEILRKRIEEKWYLLLVKKLVNKLLTLTGTGMTLKGYYISK